MSSPTMSAGEAWQADIARRKAENNPLGLPTVSTVDADAAWQQHVARTTATSGGVWDSEPPRSMAKQYADTYGGDVVQTGGKLPATNVMGSDASYPLMNREQFRRWEIDRMNESKLRTSERLKAHALGVYDAGASSVESAGYSFGLVGTAQERAEWGRQAAEGVIAFGKQLYNDGVGETARKWWNDLTGDDPMAIRQATATGTGFGLGIAGGYLTGRIAGTKMPTNVGVRSRVFNGFDIDPNLPPPAAGWDYSPGLVQRAATENQAYSHWTGFQAEIALANDVAKTHVVVKWGDVVGARGSDVISVDPTSAAVTLWDSKFRAGATSIGQSPTFSSSSRLSNAVSEAIEAVQSSSLPPAAKMIAVQELQSGTFVTKTVGAGSVRNSVIVRYVNGKPQ